MATTTKKKKSSSEEELELFRKLAKTVTEVSLDQYVKDEFLVYAWSTNLERAMVDVSGLKPVQKRIIWANYQNGMTDKSPLKKVSRAATEPMIYHPHGDSSIAGALTNMAVPNIFRVPLIFGKGAFGDVGPLQPAAASRYIECRFTAPTMLLVEEVSQNAVKMIPNFDDTEVEPERLPVKWPVAIINGTMALAVGFASNMVSHNPGEVMKACEALTKNPDLTVKQLLKIMPGPDFNMGGKILSQEGIQDYYETGKGSVKIRGSYTLEPSTRGKYKIIFHELPFGIWAEKIIEEIQKKQEAGSLKDIADYKNLSDQKNPMRLVIETKPGTNVQTIIAQLFKNTSLETTLSVNMTTLINNKPQQVGMLTLLQNFIDFRRQCITNKLTFGIEKKKDRLHLVEGLLLVLLDIDKAIAIIRASADVETARQKLMKTFKIDEIQANYVLNMQLRQLTKQDSVKLKEEKKNILDFIKQNENILKDQQLFDDFMINEFRETAKVLAKFPIRDKVILDTSRKTEIMNMTAEEIATEVKMMAREAREQEKNSAVYITQFADGKLLKTPKAFAYEDGVNIFENGPIVEQLKIMSKDNLIVITDDGIGRRMPVSYLQTNVPADVHDIGLDVPEGVSFVGLSRDKSGTVAIATQNGLAKLSNTSFPPTMETFPVIGLPAGDKVVGVRFIPSDISGYCTLISRNGNILLFDVNDLRVAGHQAGGVKAMTLKGKDDAVIFFDLIQNPNTATVLSQSTKTIKHTNLSEVSPKGRGAQGVVLQSSHNKYDPNLKLVKAFAGRDIIAITDSNLPALPLPGLTTRARFGDPFGLPITIGSRKIRMKNIVDDKNSKSSADEE